MQALLHRLLNRRPGYKISCIGGADCICGTEMRAGGETWRRWGARWHRSRRQTKRALPILAYGSNALL